MYQRAKSTHLRLWELPLRRRSLLLGAIGVIAAAGGAPGFSGVRRSAAQEPTMAAAPILDDDLQVSTRGWKTDFSKHSVPLSEIQPGGPGKDGIPPIDNPAFVSIAEADEWLEATEPVVVVAIDGATSPAARAYPIQIMIWHEIVNDELGGEPVLVTFCPLCNTAIAFDRRLEPGGTVYDFGTTGNLRFSDLVMWDRQTESWWQQLTGEAIVGELTGARLTPIPAQILGWETFKERYPDGDVLSRETGFSRTYGSNPYVGYDSITSSPFLFRGDADDRLPPMARVVGVETGGAAAAFEIAEPIVTTVFEQEVGGRAIVVFVTPGSRSATSASEIAESRDVGQQGVFDREFDGQTLTFSATDDRFQDAETGTFWDVTGRATEGPLAGGQLLPLPHVVSFWFAWAAGYPETALISAEN